MTTLKQEALTAIAQLPETADVDTMMYSPAINTKLKCLIHIK